MDVSHFQMLRTSFSFGSMKKSHRGKVFYHSAGIFGGFERLLCNDKHQRFLRNDNAIVGAFKLQHKMRS
jgi:hypothetical protein